MEEILTHDELEQLSQFGLPEFHDPIPYIHVEEIARYTRKKTLIEVGKWLMEQELGDTGIIEIHTDDDELQSLLKGEMPE